MFKLKTKTIIHRKTTVKMLSDKSERSYFTDGMKKDCLERKTFSMGQEIEGRFYIHTIFFPLTMWMTLSFPVQVSWEPSFFQQMDHSDAMICVGF